MNQNWKFFRGVVPNGADTSLEDTQWEKVSLPHTWNNIDGQDGTKNGANINETDYYRGDGWYRKRLAVPQEYAGKQLLLRFEGVNMQAEVYLNGTLAGTHKGGYTAFCVDITALVQAGQESLLAVRVNNSRVQDIAPLTADFTFYGGIYRPVELIAVEKVHFKRTDHASCGLKITTPSVTKARADCIVDAVLQNDTQTRKTITVTAVLGNAPHWQKNERILRTPWQQKPEQEIEEQRLSREITLEPMSESAVSFAFSVENPHLWNGRADPYRYGVHMEAEAEKGCIDRLCDFVGFRFFSVDTEKGFYLNGRPYPLRGVSRHQDRKGLGNALTRQEHDEDFALLYEIGATAVRLAHYPQAAYFYSLCDAYGIVVWAEIPFVDLVGGAGTYASPDAERSAFFDITKQQLTELIRQNYNHPSIVCWGLQNEVKATFDSVMCPYMEELHALAKKEDPHRLTAQATNHPVADGWQSDLYAWNVYPGWYGMNRKQLGWFMDKKRSKTRPTGLSEYGAGGNFMQHEQKPKKPRHDGNWHPEEYQTICHEAFLMQINKRPYLWCTFVWNMFDFGSDGRNEGAQPGMNDKGIISFDRKVKKDTFYVYQSNWYEFPMVQIGESRFTEREKKTMDIKVYSNCDEVEAFFNGKSLGVKRQEDNRQRGIFVWKRKKLQEGENPVRAVARHQGETLEHTAVFKSK